VAKLLYFDVGVAPESGLTKEGTMYASHDVHLFTLEALNPRGKEPFIPTGIMVRLTNRKPHVRRRQS
jgi:hypothetical protein